MVLALPSPLPLRALTRCSASLGLPTLGYTFVSPFRSVRYRAGVLRCAPFASVLRFAPVASLLRLPSQGYTFVFPLGSVRFRAGVRSRSCRPTGCLRQATQPAPAGMCSLPLILPYRAPCGSLIRRFQLLTLAGLLMQSFSATASIPERLPKPPGSRVTCWEGLFLHRCHRFSQI